MSCTSTRLQGLQGLQGLTKRNEVWGGFRDLQARQVEMSRSASRRSQCPKEQAPAARKGHSLWNKVHGVAMEEERRAAGAGDVHVLTYSTKSAAATGVPAASRLHDHL